MKTSVLCFLFFVLCSDAWAQLTCTNCTLTPQGGTPSSTTATVTSLSILAVSGTFTGSISLTGDSQFTITGAGNYILSGPITGTHPTGKYSLTLNAPGTATTGYTAGLTFSGTQANSYGSTTINSGYIICDKSPDVVAIPGNIKLAGSTVPSHLWFRANNQMPDTIVVDFTGTTNSYFSLNGTTQTIAGLVANTAGAVVENTGAANSHPAGIAQVSTQPATLNIKAGTGSYTYGGGARIRKGGTAAGDLTVHVRTGTQIIKNPEGHINDVTFTTAVGATLEFNTDGDFDYSLGTGITFRGDGTIKKTGSEPLLVNGATYLTAGKMWMSGGMWRSQGASLYTNGTISNMATLQLDAWGSFDIRGNATIFGGLTGLYGAAVHNDLGQGDDGYADFTIIQNDTATPAIFDGVITDNQPDNPVSTGNLSGGIRLRKKGAGTQVLSNFNRYTGSTTVSAGTLKLQGEGQFGIVNKITFPTTLPTTYPPIYGGALEISNVPAADSTAIFEHNGTLPQVFNGPITNTAGTGDIKGIFRQSGTGKSIINGVNTFSGRVEVTGGFLGGTGNLKNAAGVSVAATGSIGGGDGVAAGGTLIVSGLSLAADSKLVVTSKSATDNTPGLVDVKARATDTQGTITVAGEFIVDVLSANLESGRIIGCTNGLTGSLPLPLPLPLPRIGQNNTGKFVTFSWAADGLYMNIITMAPGLACNNCRFGSGTDRKTGTPTSPATILTSPAAPFAGEITLTGDSQFVITGAGNYILSGRITGTHPTGKYSLTLTASGAGSTATTGYTAGLTFSGTQANSYGSTTINSGYIICNKSPDVLAIPGNVNLNGSAVQSHLWFRANNQLPENAVVDFTGTTNSYFALNGTTQTIAGLVANTAGAVVENNGAANSRPAGITDALSTDEATLNIKAGTGNYIYGGGARIRKGGTAAGALTVHVRNGTQIIKNPEGHINDVTFTTEAGATPEATLEFNTDGSFLPDYTLGTGITFRGGGTIKKTGDRPLLVNGATYLTAGKMWMSGGMWRSQGASLYNTTLPAIYGGALEIANVPGASPATFEHNGTQTQVFTGNMTNNTGTGTTKGKFLQSGSGKSIINGAKSFTGQVNITGGFLGGTGDLRNAASVTVEAGGSIGGGDKVADNGGTLTVANLTFATAASKLIVTSTAGSTPGLSLVEVKTGAGAPGVITAANGFRVELTGTNLVSGYILKCSNGVGLQRPTVELPANSPLAGKVGLNWDAVGLWMQISAGTITLGTVSSVCPKGTNADNPVITVTATYSEESDIPSPFVVSAGYFTLSNNAAKSGDISVSRVGNVITAQFDGANPTEGDLSYTITYNDHKNPAVTSGAQRINRLPALSLSTGTTHTCIGASLVLQATAGNRAVTITSSDPIKATVGDISATKSATVTTVASGNVNFWASDADGCRSGIVTVLLNAIPVITPAGPSVCTGGTLVLAADQDPATTSAWVVAGTGATLEPPTPADGKKINFKAGTTAQNVTVEYTDHQGCKATTPVTISAGFTLTHTSTSPVCSGAKTNILLTPSSTTNTTYTWTVSGNSVGALPQSTPVTSNRIEQTLSNSGSAPATVTYSVTGTSGTCSSNVVSIVVEVSSLQAATGTVAGGGQFCAGPENNTYRTNLIPSAAGTNVEWTYTTSFPQNQAAGAISGHNPPPAKGPLTAVSDNLVLSGNVPAEIDYVFTPYTGCAGTPTTVSVKLYPVPVAGAVANSSLCSSSDPVHPKTNIVLSSTTTGTVAYTWTVNKTNSAGVSGYSEPSRAGAVVANTNPAAAASGPIVDALLLRATALKAQTIKYNITPWLSGCPGKAVTADVMVYPRPVITGLSPTASICTGTRTTLTLSNNFSVPEKNQVTYSWLAANNHTTGAQPSAGNQTAFAQQILSLTEGATEGHVTYTFTPLFTPVAGGGLSCVGQSVTSVYTLFPLVAAGTLDTTPVKACFGDQITINATPAGTNFQWLQNGTVISGATGSSYVVPTTTVLDAKYVVRLTNACGHSDSDGKEVKVTQDAYFADAKAEGPANGEGESNQPVKFTYTGPAAVFSWDFDDRTAFSIAQNPTHSYVKAATYKPKLYVAKKDQVVCHKTFNLPSLKIKEGTATGDPTGSVTLSVFPIPAHDRLTIVNADDLQHITISDISGKTVMGEAVNGREAVLSIGHLADGIYLLTVIDSKGVRRLKINKN